MRNVTQDDDMSLDDLELLHKAVLLLENQGFARLINNVAGKPTEKALQLVPRRFKRQIDKHVNRALIAALNVALVSLDKKADDTSNSWKPVIASSIAGGISGLFGVAGFAAELPVTTTMILRSIADIAKHNGEDLTSISAKLACVEVLALGTPVEEKHTQSSYFISRDHFVRFSGNAAEALSIAGVNAIQGPAVNGFLGEIGAKFAIVVWERAATSSIPVIGLVGGSAGNALFMKYFLDLASGHFIVRKLERKYQTSLVRMKYMEIFAALNL